MKLCLVCNFQFGDEQELCPKDLSKLVPVGKDPLIGMLIQDRYRIESLVAKGSMGVVYKAVQEAIGRVVAIKVMHGYLVNDEESMKRYHKEAKAASRLNHPNITSVYDFGVLASGQPYIVMDLLQGKALADILQERGQLTLGQTLMVFNQVCAALGEAHERGVVHRDIKPENIVIEEMPDGKSIHVKVVDFGIATFSAEGEDTIGKITKTGTVCGSPFYMSPEQCDAAKVDQRSDLYSLGIVLFECLTGKVPFESKDIYMVLSMQVKDPPPRLSKIRPDLEFTPEMEVFIAKALAKDPDIRYQNAQEFWEGLKGSATRRASKERPAPQVQQQGGRAEEGLIDPELLRQKIQEANDVMQEKAVKAQQELKARRRRRTGVSPVDRVVSLLQIVVPPVLTLIMTVALFWVVANQSIIQSILANKNPASDPVAAKSIDKLISQGKLDEARTYLEAKKKSGTFGKNDLEDWDRVCSKLARREVKAKRYKQAIAYIDQLSSEGKDDDEIKNLYKKCKKMLK